MTVTAPALPMVTVEPAMPRGSDEYERKRAAIQQRLADSIPVALRLSQEAISAAPKNVTSVPRSCGLLTPRELSITEDHDAVGLAAALAARTYTAVEVAIAFCKRAVLAHQLTCCLTEFFMDEALARAAELDAHLAATGTTVGPLHGVPVSVKAHMPLAGHHVDVGSISSQRAVEADSQAIAIVRAAGAVFFCKTNQPQLVMHLESASHHGRTLNPHNMGLTAGGSSGGEAALLAMKGAALGIGSDIGGSIRVPAAFCGIYGFKPTSNVLPRRDGLPGGATAAELTVPATWGPMARSLRDMDLLMGVFSAARPWRVDPRLSVTPWTGVATAWPPGGRPLRVGFMLHDGAIRPQPPVVRALEWAESRLRAAGTEVEVKPFAPLRTAEAVRNTRLAYFPYGVDAMRRAMAESGEPLLPLSEWVVRDAEASPTPTTEGLLAMSRAKEAFWYDWAAHWAAHDVDVLVCPAFCGPAAAHGTAKHWNYSVLFNYLDMPAAVLPTPVVAGARGAERYAEGEPLSGECEEVRGFWEGGDFEGAPVNIQVVAPRQHDSELFAALKLLGKHLDVKQ
ncbi:Amidase [Cordyceps fumosorosea ARSEF 2679]|uniref:amidase n=1 Tax=Cordyceps fumosorosea (strain ARSEF 2679) TaxID=1081104 RepID=A0A167LV85_CORFA|nr:Amidase [Cordyceps fumosorosea ARSEF 2679]OAA53552.1 Amidase [Cordyceps fumosorosea ARSEF 2679]